MTFEQKLSDIAGAVEALLDCRLASIPAQEQSGQGDVPKRLSDAMRYAALDGGKRFRPFLTVESAGLFGVKQADSLQAAAAIECIHCYSLVHDDLPAMDNDELRRGKPSAWKAYGEWTAILAGDALLTLAFELLADPAWPVDDKARAELAYLIAKAAGAAGMVGGQCLDLESDKEGARTRYGVGDIERLESMKTGALIVAACEAGAIVGAAPAASRAALVQYATMLGLAFQIADDLLDAEGETETVGKATGKDAAAGKATLVSLLGVQKAHQRLDEATDAALAALQTFGPEADTLREAARFVTSRQN